MCIMYMKDVMLHIYKHDLLKVYLGSVQGIKHIFHCIFVLLSLRFYYNVLYMLAATTVKGDTSLRQMWLSHHWTELSVRQTYLYKRQPKLLLRVSALQSELTLPIVFPVSHSQQKFTYTVIIKAWFRYVIHLYTNPVGVHFSNFYFIHFSI